jgi:hypothetical protein
MQSSPDYEMFRGEVYLGTVTIVQKKCDFPWVVGVIDPTDAFDAVRELSRQKLELQSGERSKEELDKAYELFLQLMEPGIWVKNLRSGERLKLLGLNVEGNEVSWRWASPD